MQHTVAKIPVWKAQTGSEVIRNWYIPCTNQSVVYTLRVYFLSLEHYVSSSGTISGYRTIWIILRDQYGLIVDRFTEIDVGDYGSYSVTNRHTVMLIMWELDGVLGSDRALQEGSRDVYTWVRCVDYLCFISSTNWDSISRGPMMHGTLISTTNWADMASIFTAASMGMPFNSIWFYHSLECIIRFSRQFMWLKVGATNRNPFVILGYYLEAVQKLGGIYNYNRHSLGMLRLS